MKDVAKAAGVSIGTVSKVINKSGNVSPKIRERVLLAISLLNYKPNGIARSLKNSKTNIIGVILPGLYDIYLMKILNNIEKIASAKGYKIIYCSTNGELAKEIKSLQWLIEKRVDGILFYPTSEELTDVEIPPSIPVVLIERELKNYKFPTIMHEHVEACRQLIEPLTQKQSLLFFHGSQNDSVERSKITGFFKALEHLGIEKESDCFKEVNVKHDRTFIADYIKQTISSTPKVSGVVATNPILLSESIKVSEELGLVDQTDFEICGFGDIDPFEIRRNKIRIAKEQPNELARVALSSLLDQMNKSCKVVSKNLYVTHTFQN
ncbi:catabolite control protein A [Halalkalibacter wakoensis JCM 9140]|uniref:Catabolite control protein A n=1 Tax=Halalkalibacter wakoensis JCM 9140 TaxID=1236970 RepID=W4Q5F7_9BACI|nr:LacI family DNA-binding transcriptional regulator [Halalkalibacter wakoensis]GAE26913.1 catabolite control protein A [Halalkalibacter wakoensis JCM 9140]